ncbi:MAG: STAS domain-containing protein [Synechococcales bacterium]|nr:STAS domain-containing protein [Synechococcales bacterium]
MLKVFQPKEFLTEVNAFEIRNWVQESLSAGATHLLVDLQSVKFINSSGLGALAVALKIVREAGGQFALCNLNDQARMTLEISGMDQAIAIYDSREDFEAAVPAVLQPEPLAASGEY